MELPTKRIAGRLATAAMIAAGLSMPAFADPTVLVVAKAQDPTSLDPAVTMTNNDWTVIYPTYQRLVRYQVKDGIGQTTVEGELAKSWTASADGKTWTFELESGHRFDDGTPVTAAAVKYSFDRLMAMKQGPAEVFPTLESVEVVDDDTVVFNLSDAFAPFIYSLSTAGSAIINPAVAEKAKDGDMGQAWLSGHSAGSGAYRVASWEKGQSLVLETNPHYGGEKPALSKVIIKMIGEASARRLQLVSGDVDIAESLPVDQLDAISANPDIEVQSHPSLQVTYLYLNNERPPLDDPDVRAAIAYAIDYAGIIDGILLGNGTQMRGPIPEGMWGHDPSLKQYSRDVEAAKALLSGKDIRELGYLYATTDPNWEPIGLTVQANLADLGIEVEMQNLAYATMRERLDRGEFDIAAGNWTPDFADPFMFMNYWFDSSRHGLAGNRSFYTNERVDALIREAALLSDQEDREALYREAQRIVVDDNVYVYLFQKNERIALRKSVEGYVYNPMLLQIYNFASMSKSE